MLASLSLSFSLSLCLSLSVSLCLCIHLLMHACTCERVCVRICLCGYVDRYEADVTCFDGVIERVLMWEPRILLILLNFT